jgi:hypothetical protein
MNNKGLKTDPWGTPHFIVPQLDVDFCCYLEVLFLHSASYLTNHWQSIPHIPHQNNTPRRILSNAVAELQKIPPLSFWWFNAVRILSVGVKTVFSIAIPLLNPNCYVINILLACKSLFNLWNIWVSKSWESCQYWQRTVVCHFRFIALFIYGLNYWMLKSLRINTRLQWRLTYVMEWFTFFRCTAS